MENNRNLFITIAASVLILTLWQVFYMNPRIESERRAAEIEAARVEEQKKDQPATPGDAVTPAPAGTVPGGVPGTDDVFSKFDVLVSSVAGALSGKAGGAR